MKKKKSRSAVKKAKSSGPAVKKAAGKGLVIERVFDALPERLWAAWTVPEFFMRWWGPKGFTSPSCRIDLAAGGTYLACMRSPEGREIWSTGIYREVVTEKKLVMTDNFSDDKGNRVPAKFYGLDRNFPEAEVTVKFEAQKGKTRMTVRHAGIPAEYRDDTKKGLNESFDKLDGILARVKFSAPAGKPEVVETAEFDAPRAWVFRALTDQGLIPKWWGPRSLTTRVDKMELKPGGAWRFVQHDLRGKEFAFNGKFVEVAPPSRISMTFEFEERPGHVLTETIELSEKNGKTRLLERSVYASLEDRDTMVKEGMASGAVESMDRLAELLSAK